MKQQKPKQPKKKTYSPPEIKKRGQLDKQIRIATVC